MTAPRPGRPEDAIAGVVPRAVLAPETVEEAAEAVRAAARDRARLAFVGGGTDLGLGAPPEGLDLVLRTEKLSRIVEHAPSDQIVKAEAGVTLAALQRTLSAHGQRLALDPPHPDRATLGGIVCANAFGPLRTRYGTVRDLIIGIGIVRADGVAARGGGKVVKNVAGFDLPRLMVGSMGTLALVTSVTFRLHPLPEQETTVLFPGVEPGKAASLLAETRRGQLEPSAAAALASGERLDLGVRFEGFAAGVAEQRERLLALGRAAGLAGEVLDGASAKAFWERHRAVREGAGVRVKLSARPTALEALARDALAPLRSALAGGAVVYPTLGLAFAAGEPASPEEVARAVERARVALGPAGGSVVVQEASPAVRARLDVWGPPPASIVLMRRLKERLDPDRRLAPGRFLGGM